MSSFDLATLPQPLPTYFGTEDHSQTLSLFSETASVRDEGASHTGLAEIKTWLDRVEASYHPRYVVQGAEQDGDQQIVTVQVSGTFPGSPIVLRQAFGIEHGKIASIQTL